MWYDIARGIQTEYIMILCCVAFIFIMLPSILYLFTTWRQRRDRLLDRFTSSAVRLYYQRFYPSRHKRIEGWDEQRVLADFRKLFAEAYGRKFFILPLFLLAVISALGLWATEVTVTAWLADPPTPAPFPAIAISAFLGAYTWVLLDQISRFRSEDFTASDLYHGGFRLLISVPLGMSLAAFANEESGVAIAFLLAAFPTQTLMRLSRRLVNSKFDIGENKSGDASELEQLQGVAKTNAERLHDEGITTIAELAWADPVKLSIETNRDFRFVADAVGQALLWVYLEGNVRQLYVLSLRGAHDACALIAKLPGSMQTVAEAAKLLKMDPHVFLNTLYTVRHDPNAQFLYQIQNWDTSQRTALEVMA